MDTDRPRVLVVDDDADQLAVFERSFADDFDVTIAWSGLEALDLLACEDFDVVVSDYAMPGLNGLALLRSVRNSWPGVGRVLVSAHAELEIIKDAREEGVVHAVIEKPWTPGDIRDVTLGLREMLL